MSSITTRSTGTTGVGGVTRKDAPLSNTEIDNNFININTDKLEITDTTSANTANKVVKRDASGNFSAGTITADLSGTASKATNIAGGAAGSTPYNTGNGVTAFLSAGVNGQIMKFGASSAPTWVDQSSLSVGSASVLAVARNISIGTAVTATATSFNGNSDITIPITAINADYISSGTLAAARLGTTGNPQFNSIGVGVAANGTAGRIDATSIVAGTVTETSSITLKENINPIENALNSILLLNGVIYDRKDGSAKNEPGMIAEHVDKIIPNLVTKDADGNVEGITYTKVVAYLVEAIKELKEEIDSLKGSK